MSVPDESAGSLAQTGLEWLSASAASVGDGLAWTGVSSGDEVDPTLYSGGAGIVLRWCHGPTGDAQVFRLLHQLAADQRWLHLQDACWRTVIEFGIPRRLRPGFRDNSGHCCGTAGVLALAAPPASYASYCAMHGSSTAGTTHTPSPGPTSQKP